MGDSSFSPVFGLARLRLTKAVAVAALTAVFAVVLATITPGVAAAVVDENQKIQAPGDDVFAMGFSVAVDGDRMVIGAPDASADRFGVPQAGAGKAYVYERSGSETPWILQTELVAELPRENAQFGYSVAIENGMIAVGEPATAVAGAGRMYVYFGTGSAWSRFDTIENGSPENDGGLGYSVAIVDQIVYAGEPFADDDPFEPGSGRVWRWFEGGSAVWDGYVVNGITPVAGAQVGFSVAADFASDSTLRAVIGSPGNDTVYIVKDGGRGEQFASASGSVTNEAGFGLAVAIDDEGENIAVAASSGNLFIVQEETPDVWQVIKGPIPNGDPVGPNTRKWVDIDDGYLVAGVGGSGGDVAIYETVNFDQVDVFRGTTHQAGDLFGVAVAIDGLVLAAGAPGVDDVNVDGGAVYVTDLPTEFATPSTDAQVDVDGDWGVVSRVSANVQVLEKANGSWSPGQTLTLPADSTVGAALRVAISEQFIAVGDAGAQRVLLYTRGTDGSFDLLQTIVAPEGGPFGSSLDMSASYLIVGNPRDDFDTVGGAGAYVFELSDAGANVNAGEFAGLQCAVAGNPSNNGCGTSVAISSVDRIAWVGAPLDDTYGTDAGAVYRFQEDSPAPAILWSAAADNPIGTAVIDTGGFFGTAVATDGSRSAGAALIAGAPGDLEGAGSVWTLQVNGITTDLTQLDTGAGVDDGLGATVDSSGDLLAAGFANSADGYRLYAHNTDGNGYAQVPTNPLSATPVYADVAIDSMDIIVGYDTTLFIASTIDPLPSQPANKLLAGNGSELDRFGSESDLNDNTMVIGAYTADGSSADNRATAYVFTSADGGATWAEDQTLQLSVDEPITAVALGDTHLALAGRTTVDVFERPDADSPFAAAPSFSRNDPTAIGDYALSIDGDTLAIGFANSCNDCPFIDIVDLTTGVSSQFIIGDLAPFSELGFDVALAGNVLAAVGAGTLTTGGYIFERPDETSLFDVAGVTSVGPFIDNDSGVATVDTDGQRVLFGDPTDDGANGTAFVYEKVLGNWTETELPQPSGDLGGENRVGSAVAIEGDVLVLGANNGESNAQGHLHTYAFDGDAWVETASPVLATDGETSDTLGSTIALDGLRVVAGAPTEDQNGTNAGAAYVFDIAAPPVVEPANKILIDGGVDGDLAGLATAVAGNVLVIGAPQYSSSPNGVFGNDEDGAVFVYTRVDQASPWTFAARLDNPAGEVLDEFGAAVAFDGNNLIVGAPSATANGVNNAGVVYRFEPLSFPSDFVLTETYTAPAPASSSRFGDFLALSGPTMIVGAYLENDGAVIDVGATYFYDLTGTPDAVAELRGEATNDGFGRDVAIDGTLAAVAGSNYGTGLPYIQTFTIDANGVPQPLERIDSPTSSNDLYGSSIDIDGETLVVGVPNGNVGGQAIGQTFVYELDGATWTGPLELVPDTASTPDANFGFDVAIDDGLIVVGARDADNLVTQGGSAHVFARTETGWEEAAFFTASDTAELDNLGWSVAIQNDEIFVGAPLDDNTNGPSEPGAVYLWNVDQPVLDTPTLTVSLTPSVSTVAAGATAISVVDLPPTALEGFGDADSNIAGTSLAVVAANETDEQPVEVLERSTIGSLDINPDLLSSVLLSDVPIEGGWQVILDSDPAFAGRPIHTVTLGEVIAAGLLDGLSISVLDLSSTPIGSIPIGSIPIGSIPIGSIPIGSIPIGSIGGPFASWCDYLATVVPERTCSEDPADDTADLNAATDSILELAIKGVPIGSIPIGSIPIGSIPIGSIPIGSIPIGSIDIAGTPIGSIPIGSIDLAQTPIGSIPIGSIPIGSIPIGSIPIGSIPIGSIDVGATPIGSITLGQLNDDGDIAASPIGSIPIGSIPIGSIPIGSIPIGSIPIGSIPIGSISVDTLESTPIGSIPIGAIPIGSIPIGSIDIAESPIGSIPIGSIDVASAPIGSIPIGSIPIGSIPIGSIPIGSIDVGALPIGSIPIGSIPIGSIPIGSIPIGSIPIGSIPIGSIGDVVDCSLIDCDGDFTLADAQAAGALKATATLAFLDDTDTDLRLSDLIGLNGMTIADLYAQLAAIPDFDELADFEDFADMVLAELIGLDGLNDTTLAELGDGLSFVTFADLVLSIDGLDEATVRSVLVAEGIATLRDLLVNTPHGDGIVLSGLPESDPNYQAQTIEFLLSAMGGIRLADIFDLDDTDLNTVDWGTLTFEDITDWEDVTLAEFVELLVALAEDGDPSNDVLVSQLVNALLPDAADDLTYGDLLLSLLAAYTYDWQEIDLAALDLDSAAPVGFSADLTVNSLLPTNRTVEIQATLPVDGRYMADSTTLIDEGGNAFIIDEPTQAGASLTWIADGLTPNTGYTLGFDVSPSLTLGSRPFAIDTSLVGKDVFAANATTVTVTEAYEPNDNIGDSNIVSVASDTIYVSHVSDDTDIDLYSVDLAAGARLAVSLSSLPADYDLVVYGPTNEPLVPLSLRQIDPTESPELGVDPTETSSGNVSSDEIVLQDRPVVALSANRDLADDFVDIGAVRTTGTYFIQVSGYNGANSPEPYALFVDTQEPPLPLNCVAQDYQGGSTATLPTDAELAGVNTLILVNGERMTAKYGATETADVFTALDATVDYTNNVNPGFGINAAVIPLDGSAAIRAAYNALDAESCQPERANDVVREIASLIADLRDADPATDIGHIMIVGDDDIVPMARIADYTTIANEETYASTFLNTDANSLFGAASLRYFLSDEPYGDVDPIIFGSGGSDRALYVTDTALGRVLETPAEIVGQLGLFISSQGELDPSSAVVSGYDFLTDGAQAIADTFDGFAETTLSPPLINETWTSTDLLDEIYPAAGDSPSIAAINAHYDHYRALPADGNATGSEEDLFTTSDITDPLVSGELAGHLYFSMGCHGGLSVPDELFPGDPRALDWAQAYAQEQAIWVGNTGYGYGETRTPDGVELSERLMLHFAQRLDGSLTAGEALYFAKQWYLGTQKSAYGEYDEKVLQQATFYGIPFFKLGVVSPPPPEPIPPQPLVYPLPNADIDVSTIISDPFFTEQISPFGDGSSWTADVPAGAEGTTGSQATPFTQIQPTISFDVSNVDQLSGDPVAIAQGALITSMTTRDVLDVDPDLARPVVDDSTNEVEPIVGDVFSDLTVYVSQYREPEGERQQLTATLGSFSSNEDDFSITGVGTQRLFEDIGFEVLYRDLASDQDQEKPTFLQVEAAVVDTGADSILVIDTEVIDVDAGNIAGGEAGTVVRATALVGEDLGTGETEWTPVELTNVSDNVWSGSVSVSGSEVEYLLQAVDANGNVALSANKGRYFVEQTGVTPPPPPPEIDVDIDRAPDAEGFYNDVVTITAEAGGADVDYQIDDDDIVDAGTGATVVLDPAVLGDGVHTVTISSPAADDDYVVTVVFDTTPPVITIASPLDGATLQQGDPVDARFVCSDAASGVAGCEATLNGAPIDVDDPVTGSAGTFTLAVTATDSLNNVTTATLTFTVDQVAPPSCGALTQEGEAGTLMGEFAVGADGQASGGEYVYVPDDVGNTYAVDPSSYVEYCVTITTPGNHRIDARTIASNFRDDSFFVQIDGGDIGIWDVKRSSDWTTDSVSSRGIADPVVVDLGPGDHTIRFYLREDATLLDAFELVWLNPGSYGGPAECLGLAQEAEVGTVSGFVEVISDGAASGGQGVAAPASSGRFYSPNFNNYAEYCVTIDPADAGTFRIDATTIAPNFLRDSFFVQIDDDPDLILWDVKRSSTWTTDAVSDRNVADPFTIQLDAGDHSIRFIQREGGTKLDKFELVPVGAVNECGALSPQAEDGTVSGSMQVLGNPEAAGGLSVGVPEGTGNTYSVDPASYVEYCFTVSESDTFRIRASASGPDNRSDSFFVQMNDEDPIVWHLRRSNRFVRQVVRDGSFGPANFTLDPGEHRLRFYHREDGASIDSLTIYRD